MQFLECQIKVVRYRIGLDVEGWMRRRAGTAVRRVGREEYLPAQLHQRRVFTPEQSLQMRASFEPSQHLARGLICVDSSPGKANDQAMRNRAGKLRNQAPERIETRFA